MNEQHHERFMRIALAQARQALAAGDFPVGCALVYQNEVLVTGARTGTSGGSANEIDHAEMTALRRLSELDTPWVPEQVTAYCTMEPCLMCFSALMLSGIGTVVYAYEDVMGGGTGCSRQTLAPLYRDNQIATVAHVLRSESLQLFQQFFRNPVNRYWEDSLLCRYTLEQTIG
jgi:tRNA(adenine34) deaminase